MDIKDNEHVLDTNHYRRVVEEYEKNFMNGFTKEQQEEYIFKVHKQSGKIESIQIKDWQVVSDKCQLLI